MVRLLALLPLSNMERQVRDRPAELFATVTSLLRAAALVGLRVVCASYLLLRGVHIPMLPFHRKNGCDLVAILAQARWRLGRERASVARSTCWVLSGRVAARLRARRRSAREAATFRQRHQLLPFQWIRGTIERVDPSRGARRPSGAVVRAVQEAFQFLARVQQ